MLEQFVDNGWCEVVDSASDKRFRHVVASAKLTRAFEAYESICFASYSRLAVAQATDIQSSCDEAFQLVSASEEHNPDEQMS